MPHVQLEVTAGAQNAGNVSVQRNMRTSFHSEGTGHSTEGVSSEYRQVWFRIPDATWPMVSPNPYSGNRICTSKYTFYNFLVINLFAQFSRVANLYFLFIAVLQLVPGLSPTHWFTTVAPLLFVLLVNAFKEIYDDYYRHKSDDEVNNRRIEVFGTDGTWKICKWKGLQVGDVIRVVRDDEVPADIVFLASHDKENLCYVETANLDGETNLKMKYCYSKTAAETLEELMESEGLPQKFIECELPNEKLYQFEGSVVDETGEREMLDISNLVLRGCTLRKTDWIVGVVVFAGVETKIQCNQSTAPRKVTRLEGHMNLLVILVFIIQVMLAVVGALGRQFWLGEHDAHYYLETVDGWPELGRGYVGAVVTILRFVILLNQLIPISLYVTLEVVKVVQCLFLNWDRAMYCKRQDTPFVCRTTTLNEDLGQVEFVLSDKTGTLTQNIMGFVWASIGGKLYGSPASNILEPNSCLDACERTPHSIVLDESLRQVIRRKPGSLPVELKDQENVDMFMVGLAVCNTVMPTVDSDGQLQYQAESPDEEALVEGAAYLGYRLISRSTSKVEIEVHGERMLEYKVLAVLEFNSDRKRMSILCQCPDGVKRLFCKGADSVIMQRLAQNQNHLTATTSHVALMAKNGFRTLLIAKRDISESEYAQWRVEFHNACVSLESREDKVASVSEKIEKHLILAGATAVEDKLQEGVPDAVASLSQAGVKIWVLTGDKLETAIVISRSCNLITENMDIVEIRESDMQTGRKDRSLRKKVLEVQERISSGVGLVIEGGALAILLSPNLQEAFLEMCKICKAVVCCRVSPIQKAQVANLVKRRAGAITLAIGDGANDVSMIKAAHIGVGISGREGRAAVLASDFSMCQFSFLARLLLVHGRWSYKRNSEVVLYAFYKNFAYCLANVYFNFGCAGFSSQPIYGSALIATYNLFWTSLPTMAFAIFEQDVKAETALAAPQIYMETMHESGKSFFVSLGRWLFEALWHSLLTFWLPLYTLGSANENGKLVGLDGAGVAIYTAVIVTVNLKVAVRTQHWTIVNAVTLFGISIGLWFPFLYLCSMVWEWYGILESMSGIAYILFSSPSFWLSAVVGAPLMSIMLDIMFMTFCTRFLPSTSRIFQEREKLPENPDASNPSVNEGAANSWELQDRHSFTTPRYNS